MACQGNRARILSFRTLETGGFASSRCTWWELMLLRSQQPAAGDIRKPHVGLRRESTEAARPRRGFLHHAENPQLEISEFHLIADLRLELIQQRRLQQNPGFLRKPPPCVRRLGFHLPVERIAALDAADLHQARAAVRKSQHRRKRRLAADVPRHRGELGEVRVA